jgi:hypothetical protein
MPWIAPLVGSNRRQLGELGSNPFSPGSVMAKLWLGISSAAAPRPPSGRRAAGPARQCRDEAPSPLHILVNDISLTSPRVSEYPDCGLEAVQLCAVELRPNDCHCGRRLGERLGHPLPTGTPDLEVEGAGPPGSGVVHLNGAEEALSEVSGREHELLESTILPALDLEVFGLQPDRQCGQEGSYDRTDQAD